MEQNTINAYTNLKKLSQNLYPGRIIISGIDQSGKYLVQVYGIMGRSDNSRNRQFTVNGAKGGLWTKPVDPATVKDPELIIYPAMLEASGTFAVSNGRQTETAVSCGNFREECLEDDSFYRQWKYEPDAPNFTPRITSIFTHDEDENLLMQISILKKHCHSEECIHEIFKYRRKDLFPGFGYCVHTYEQDGNPLPSFKGSPYLVPLIGNQVNILEKYWESLNENNKISLAVKFIDPTRNTSTILIKNKY